MKQFTLGSSDVETAKIMSKMNQTGKYLFWIEAREKRILMTKESVTKWFGSVEAFTDKIYQFIDGLLESSPAERKFRFDLEQMLKQFD